MQISKLLRLKHCLQRHIESPSLNEFTRRYSSFLATLRARRRKQRRATKIKGESRAILRLCWTALKTNRCKKMKIYNTALKLSQFIHIMLRKIVLNSGQFLEYFWNFCGGLKLQGITNKKIPPLYLRKNLLATAGNLNVNEQTKYKSVPIFLLLFLAIERKPEIRNY